ncbi:hypothetical protein [Nocardioides sp. B-3]|uniref:hypothetical protein n=1 Tax=Nocardioides sp. B-3 TaxID=2895565 RepID=UPI00215380C3|nr:hypothetical protein [Nocardioides sp. B-3]UUZ60057.1 hypothetical protein LP418_03425 [Nocardioides sp. B-3]
MTHTDELLDPHEAELRDLLERTMNDTTAPLEIGPHALRQGRRLRTRRRLGIAAGAVAAGTVVALVLPTALGSGTTAIDPAGAPSSSASEQSPEPPTAEVPEGWWSIPSTEMISTVEAILPDGVTVTSPGPLTLDGPEDGFINAFVTGPDGPGRLHMVLLGGDESSPLIPPGADRAGTGDLMSRVVRCSAEATADDKCIELTNDAGAIIGRRLISHYGDVVMNRVTLLRGDGMVYAAVTNTLDDQPGPDSTASGETPPLTLDQLEDPVANDTG